MSEDQNITKNTSEKAELAEHMQDRLLHSGVALPSKSDLL